MKKIKKLLTSDVDLYFQMTWTQFSLVHCYLEYWYKSCNAECIQKPSSAVYMSRQRMEVIFFLGLSQHESQTRALWINCHGAEERLPSSWCWQNRLEGDKMVLAFGVLRRHGCLYLEKRWYLILYIHHLYMSLIGRELIWRGRKNESYCMWVCKCWWQMMSDKQLVIIN